ncbi:quercetin dioxygenase-like cupin family protein [Luteibacter sp. HA06]
MQRAKPTVSPRTPKPVAASWRRRVAASALLLLISNASATKSEAGKQVVTGTTAVHAFKLFTGPDNVSHVLEGNIDLSKRTKVTALHFKESAPHASLDWHNDPEPQYVITLSGTLQFETRSGETFVLRPGDVLVAEDHTGSGHKWRLIDDQPWRRGYVVLDPGEKDSFVPNSPSRQKLLP